MKKNLVLKITLSLLVLTGCLIGLNKRQDQYQHAPTKTQLLAQELMETDTLTTSTIETSYKQEFAQEEQALRENIAQKLEISISEWDNRKDKALQKMNQYGEEMYLWQQQEGTTLSKDTINNVNGILQDIGVAPNKLYLLKEKIGRQGSASAAANFIEIDEENFNKLSPERQRFVIAHEVSHTLFKDAADQSALKELIKEKYGSINQDHNELIYAISKFHEERADLYAFLYNEAAITQGAIELFSDVVHSEQPSYQGTTHPPYRQRIASAHSIDKLYKQCNHA